MATPSTHLVEYLASLTEADIGPELTQFATSALLDTVGCGLFGSRQPWGEIAAQFVLSERSSGAATLYGSASPVSPARAALANGTASHGFEIDDFIQGAQVHAGAVVVPAALAMAEQVGASGPRLLLGLICGYEMFGRVARALTIEHSLRGYHATGVAAPLAATVAAGVIMQLDVRQLLCATGIACSSASGLKAFVQGDGGMVKRWHAGRGAEAGVIACDISRRGFTGPMHAIDGQFGLLQVIGGSAARPELLDKELGNGFAIAREVWVKVYACCGVIHSTVHGLLSLKRAHHFIPAQVKQIRVYTNRKAIVQNAEPNPQETMAAQYSIPFSAGVAIAKDPTDPMAYLGSNLQDPVVHALASRTTLALDPEMDRLYPAHMGARVEVSLMDGQELQSTVLDAHGSMADPCTPAELEAKFRRLAGYAKRPDTADRIIAAVRNVSTASSLEILSKALREPGV